MNKCKIISIVLVLILIGSSVAIADEFDPKKYSTEELQVMYSMIEKELEARGSTVGSFIPWFNSNMGVMLPLFVLKSGEKLKIGTLMFNTDTDFFVTVDNATEEDFQNYILLLRMAGFTENEQLSSINFEASNKEGYKVSVICWGSSGTTVQMYPPEK